MGLVLTFEPTTGKVPRSRIDRPCEITIFPGVRYERHLPVSDMTTLQPEGPEKPPVGRRKKR